MLSGTRASMCPGSALFKSNHGKYTWRADDGCSIYTAVVAGGVVLIVRLCRLATCVQTSTPAVVHSFKFLGSGHPPSQQTLPTSQHPTVYLRFQTIRPVLRTQFSLDIAPFEAMTSSAKIRV